MNTKRITALTAFAGLLGFAAFLPTSCSSSKTCKASYKDVGDEGAACIQTASSTAACFAKPQMCPNLTPIFFNNRLVSTETPVNVLLENRGEEPMKISSIKVRGDTRCAFKKAMFSPAVGSSIEPGDSMVVRFKYVTPATAGEDHATIEIISDSENLPTLQIPVCGKAVTSSTTQMHLDCQNTRAAAFTDCFEMQ